MTIAELCGLLKAELLDNGYAYGFYAEGRRFQPRRDGGFDREYYDCSLTLYRVQDPAVTRREKLATCVDAVALMRALLTERGVPCRIWLLRNPEKGSLHTVLTFKAEGQTVYLELTPQSAKPWYGRELLYPSEDAFLEEWQDAGFILTDVSADIQIGQFPAFLADSN